jgi:hypothetical protein
MQLSRFSVTLTEHYRRLAADFFMPWILLPSHDDDRPRARAKEQSLLGLPMGYNKARRARSGVFDVPSECFFAQLNSTAVLHRGELDPSKTNFDLIERFLN